MDRQVSRYAHRVGPAQLDRLVAEAVARFDPDAAAAQIERQWDGRHVTFHHDRLSFAGTTHLEAELDLTDALDLDSAVTRQAAQLAELGSVEPLDARRATALGEIARRDLTLDLPAADPAADPGEAGSTASTSPSVGARSGRQVVLYAHVSADALTGASPAGGLQLARVEQTNRVVTADQVRSWCGAAAAVTVRAVIDLDQGVHHQSYEIADRLAEQVRLRDVTCVFPWCTRTARQADLDHIQSYDPGDHERGPTSDVNLAALCRRHHRLKTHGGWTYHRAAASAYEWTSPHGATYLRDHTGTVPLRFPPRSRPRC